MIDTSAASQSNATGSLGVETHCPLPCYSTLDQFAFGAGTFFLGAALEYLTQQISQQGGDSMVGQAVTTLESWMNWARGKLQNSAVYDRDFTGTNDLPTGSTPPWSSSFPFPARDGTPGRGTVPVFVVTVGDGAGRNSPPTTVRTSCTTSTSISGNGSVNVTTTSNVAVEGRNQ